MGGDEEPQEDLEILTEFKKHNWDQKQINSAYHALEEMRRLAADDAKQKILKKRTAGIDDESIREMELFLENEKIEDEAIKTKRPFSEFDVIHKALRSKLDDVTLKTNKAEPLKSIIDLMDAIPTDLRPLERAKILYSTMDAASSGTLSADIILAIRANELDTLRALTEFDFDPNFCDNFGTFLHYATAFGSPEAVELMEENGCNVNAINHSEETPLHVLFKRNYREEVAQYLIQNGRLPAVG